MKKENCRVASALMLLYNIVVFVIYILASVPLLARMIRKKGSLHRFFDRLGFYPRKITSKINSTSQQRIWIHAVSLGETQVALKLMKEFKRQDPSMVFIISVTTWTAWEMASKVIQNNPESPDVLVLYPMDSACVVRRAIRRLKPSAIVVVETEIWPNFIYNASRLGIPLYLTNARMSDSSVRGYYRSKFFFGHIFRCISHVYAQSAQDAERFWKAGVPKECISVGNSFKFDMPDRNTDKEKELREWIGEGEILLGGSIWPEEECVLLKAFNKLKPYHPDLKLVLVPRHATNTAEIVRHVRSSRLAYCLRSSGEKPEPGTDVFICDTMGELTSLYSVATVVFVGKTLCEHGGQNMIEACAFGKPVIVGPYTENFRQVMNILLQGNALVQIPAADAGELEDSVCNGIIRLFDEPMAAVEMGHRAEMVVQTNVGSVTDCVKDIICRLS